MAGRERSVISTGPGAGESWSEARGRYMGKKPVSHFMRDAKESGLLKSLGAADLTVLGLGAIIGAGIFVLVGVGAGRAGPGVALSFVVAGFACSLAALCYAEFASMVPVAGSAYTYTYASLGEFVAWIVGWNLVLEYAIGNVAVAVGWSGHFAEIFHVVQGDPLHAFVHSPPEGIINVPAMLVVLAIMYVLIRGVREAASTTWVFVGVKLFVLLTVIAVGAFLINPVNFDPFLPFGFLGTRPETGVLAGAAIIFFAYIGFDAVSTAAEETKNPSRDLPIGIIASLAISTVLYIAVALVATGIAPWPTIANHPAPLPAAFGAAGQEWIALPIAIGGIVGITSVLLVFALGMPRIFFSMARDGLLPRAFTKVHPKYKTPYVTTVFGSVLVAIAAGVTPIHAAAELVNIGTLFAFAVVALGVLVLRRKAPDQPRPFRIPGGPIVPLIAIVVLVGLMFSLPTVTWIRFVAWMGLGVLIYGFYGARHSRLRQSRDVVLTEKP